MQFNSLTFLVFLPTVVLAYYLMAPVYRRWMLLLASWFFYACWRWEYLWIILFTSCVDYAAGILIENAGEGGRGARRKWYLVASLLANFGLLAFFKYCNFFLDNTAWVGERFGWQLPHKWLSVVLPLGISFHTFQGVSYTVDVYRKHIKAVRSFGDFALFVAFFPQLVAGPIVRAEEYFPQMTCRTEADWGQMRRAVGRILWGMIKKVYIADAMAPLVNEAYGNPGMYSGAGLALATYAFAVQIYCDFSAYTDMALGSAMLLGIRLPENFDRPYFACSLREFWRKWHMTLSRWLRDYLYIPLGGSRRGAARTYANLLVTMLLGGLWHGAGWNWVLWGGLQGVVMAGERAIGLPEEPPRKVVWRVVRWVVTFHIVCLSWVLFRASSVGHAGTVLGRIFSWAPGAMQADLRPLAYLGLVLLAEGMGVREKWMGWLEYRPAWTRWVTYGAVTALILTFVRVTHPEFIYFAF